MKIRFAQSASKHRISRIRVRYVIEHCGLVGRQDPPPGGPAGNSDRLIYLGDDAGGIALEVMAVELEAGDLLVIHAMALRGKYRPEYEEATKWRR